jgi:hypothetical protein
MRDRPIRVVLSAPSQDELNELCYAFLGGQSRVDVAAKATTANLLEESLRQPGLEVAVIDADLLIMQGEGLRDFLNTCLGETVAVVLLSPYFKDLRGILQDLPTVRAVLIKPISQEKLLHRVYQIGVSERCPESRPEPIEGRAATPALGQGPSINSGQGPSILRRSLSQAKPRASGRALLRTSLGRALRQAPLDYDRNRQDGALRQAQGGAQDGEVGHER